MKYTYIESLDKEDRAHLNNEILANETLYDTWTTKGLTDYGKLPKHILNAYYNGRFGKLDVNIDIAYFTKKEGESTVTNENSENYADRTVNTKSDVDNDMFASKIVLNYPFLKGELSFGGEYANTKRDDAYWADQIVPSSTTRIEHKSNRFFAEYERSTKIGQFSAGLRYENTQSDYFVNNVFEKVQSKKYKQWFPSFSYFNKIKEVSLQLSYSSKTNRPSYRQLSNNTSYMNRFTLQSGNPFLSPSITHDITLAGSWKFLQLMLSYQYQKDAIIYWMEQVESEPSMAIIRYKNLDKLPQFNAYLSISPTFGIWSPQLSVGMQKQWMKLESDEGEIHLDKILPVIGFNNSFSFSKNFIVTLDSFWRGKGDVQNNHLEKSKSVVNIGVTKIFFDDRLSITVKGSDIFEGERDVHLLRNENVKLYQSNYYDGRDIEFTVRYKFNTAKSKYKGKGAGKSEIDRM